MNASDEIFGYRFSNRALLEEALTTPSRRQSDPTAHDNQRLEFLGDAVLGLLAAERLYTACPRESEGPLTVKRTQMVSAAALCKVAVRTSLVDRLRRNKGAEPLSPKAKTLADAVEAILGAVYLDGGLDAARRVFEALELTDNADVDAELLNPKGALQVRAQALTPPRHPVYELLKAEGKSHEPVFTVRVSVDGFGSAEASARSHKAAESRAAAALLSSLDRR